MVCYITCVTLYVILYYSSICYGLFGYIRLRLVLFCHIPFCSVLYCSVLFGSVLLCVVILVGFEAQLFNSEKSVNADVSMSVSAPSDRPDDCKGSRDVVFQCPERPFVARLFVPPLVRTRR